MLNFNDLLGFLKSYSSVPMNQTATAGYDLARTGQAGQLALGNRQLDTSADQFNQELALRKLNDVWQQQMAERAFNQQTQQQQFENSLASKQANLYADPTYQKFLKLTNPEFAKIDYQKQKDNIDMALQMQADRDARLAAQVPWYRRVSPLAGFKATF